jgi:hypothetical protein
MITFTAAIRNTNVRSLPMGFHKIFANIAHFSLDLRANRFETLDPVALYGNLTPWELEGTKIMQGEYGEKFKGQIQEFRNN